MSGKWGRCTTVHSKAQSYKPTMFFWDCIKCYLHSVKSKSGRHLIRKVERSNQSHDNMYLLNLTNQNGIFHGFYFIDHRQHDICAAQRV